MIISAGLRGSISVFDDRCGSWNCDVMPPWYCHLIMWADRVKLNLWSIWHCECWKKSHHGSSFRNWAQGKVIDRCCVQICQTTELRWIIYNTSPVACSKLWKGVGEASNKQITLHCISFSISKVISFCWQFVLFWKGVGGKFQGFFVFTVASLLTCLSFDAQLVVVGRC